MKKITIFLCLAFYTNTSFSQPNFDSLIVTTRRHTFENAKTHFGKEISEEVPHFKKHEVSFFTKDNSSNYYIGLFNISGLNVPYTADCNFSFINTLSQLDRNISCVGGKIGNTDTDSIVISWKKEHFCRLLINDSIFKSAIVSWRYFEASDCPETVPFPFMIFNEVIKLPDPLLNNARGLFVFPGSVKILNPKQQKAKLSTQEGDWVYGVGYDIDNDNTLDIFYFDKKINETTWITRLYQNIDGVWKCKWYDIDETCI